MMMQMQHHNWTEGHGRQRATVRVDARQVAAGPLGLRVRGVYAFAALAACSSSSVNATTFVELTGTRPASLVVDHRRQPTQSVASAVQEIRRRSALTWEQLASIFKVSRRAVHLWAAGKEARPEAKEKVFGLLDRVQAMKETRPFAVRRALLADLGVPTNEVGGELEAASNPILIADPRPLEAKLATSRTAKKTKIVRA